MLKPYQEKSQQIKDEIKKIGVSILDANQESLLALKDNNIDAFQHIDLSVKKLVTKSNEIDNLIVTTLALHSPEAKDLRHLVSYLKITNELVRAGANTRSFLKTFRKTFSDELNTSVILEYAIPLNKSANMALKHAIEMIDCCEDDTTKIDELYNKALVEESKTDDLYAMVEKNILKLITKNAELSRDYFDILSSLRRIEKVADRAVSIASLMQFAHLGGEIGQS